MKVYSIILLSCFCWTLVTSRHSQKQHGEHVAKIEWHKFGVDLSKLNIDPENCRNKIINCGEFQRQGFCRSAFYLMDHLCPLACRFCAPPEEAPRKCRNKRWECPVWAYNGDCIRHPEYMRKYCKVSCMLCGKDENDNMRFDNDTLCPTWGSVGYCKKHEVREICNHSCDVYNDTEPLSHLNPDYRNAFYHYPYYVYYPSTFLEKPSNKIPPTVAPTEHPPSEKPVIPTLPPHYSTLPPTPVFNTPDPDEGIPTIIPIKGQTGSPTPRPNEPSHPPPEPTEAPSKEPTEAPSKEPTEAPSKEPTEAPSEEPPPTEAPPENPPPPEAQPKEPPPTLAPPPDPETQPETPPQAVPPGNPPQNPEAPSSQAASQPPGNQPPGNQPQVPQPPSSQPGGGVGGGATTGGGALPGGGILPAGSSAGGGLWKSHAALGTFRHHRHHHRHLMKMHKHHYKSLAKHHKKNHTRKHKKHH